MWGHFIATAGSGTEAVRLRIRSECASPFHQVRARFVGASYPLMRPKRLAGRAMELGEESAVLERGAWLFERARWEPAAHVLRTRDEKTLAEAFLLADDLATLRREHSRPMTARDRVH